MFPSSFVEPDVLTFLSVDISVIDAVPENFTSSLLDIFHNYTFKYKLIFLTKKKKK
jgi:hypothetical protein